MNEADRGPDARGAGQGGDEASSGPHRLSSRRRVPVAVLLGGFAVLKAAYFLDYAAALPFLDAPVADAAYYHEWANRILSGQDPSDLPYYLAPLYPYFLAGVRFLCGDSPWPVLAIQGMLGLLTLFCIYRIASRVSHKAALFATALVGLYAPIPFVESKFLSETLAIALLAQGTLALVTATGARGVALAGVLLGLGVVCRPVLGLFPMLVAIALLVRKRFLQTAVLVATVAAPVLPVTIRNWVVSGEWVPITSNAGIVFAQGNNPAAQGIATPLRGFSLLIEQQQREEMEYASRALGHPATASESSAYFFRETLKQIGKDPPAHAHLFLKKAIWMLHRREARDVYSLDLERRFVATLGWFFVPFPVLLGLAVIGLLRGPRPPWVLMLLVATAVPMLVFSVSFRYRLPMIVPLGVLAGAGGRAIVEAAMRRAYPTVAAFAAVLAIAWLPSLVAYPVPRIGPEALNNLGYAYFKTGDLPSARRATEAALAADPEFAPAIYNLAVICIRAREYDRAKDLLQRYTAARPSDPHGWHNYGVALDETAEKARAEQAYRRALALDARLPETHYNLAILLYERRAYPEALRHLDDARRLGVEPDPRFVARLQAAAQGEPSHDTPPSRPEHHD